MADENLVQVLKINGVQYTVEDKNAVKQATFEQTIGDINSILDEINGEEV